MAWATTEPIPRHEILRRSTIAPATRLCGRCQGRGCDQCWWCGYEIPSLVYGRYRALARRFRRSHLARTTFCTAYGVARLELGKALMFVKLNGE